MPFHGFIEPINRGRLEFDFTAASHDPVRDQTGAPQTTGMAVHWQYSLPDRVLQLLYFHDDQGIPHAQISVIHGKPPIPTRRASAKNPLERSSVTRYTMHFQGEEPEKVGAAKSRIDFEPTTIGEGRKQQWAYMESHEPALPLEGFEKKEFEDLVRRINQTVKEKGEGIFLMPKRKSDSVWKAHALVARRYIMDLLNRQ